MVSGTGYAPAAAIVQAGAGRLFRTPDLAEGEGVPRADLGAEALIGLTHIDAAELGVELKSREISIGSDAGHASCLVSLRIAP